MRFLSFSVVFIFLLLISVAFNLLAPLYAQDEGEEGGDPGGGDGGFDLGGGGFGGFGGFDFGGLGGGGGPTETGGGPSGDTGLGDPDSPAGGLGTDDYGDPGAGNGSDNNDGSNTDGGNGVEGSGDSTDDSGNKVTLNLKADYYCRSGYIKVSWTGMENRLYRLFKDGTQVPGSPFAENILSYDDHEVTFAGNAGKEDIKYSLEYIKVDKKGKVKVTDKIDVSALAPCAPPQTPVFTSINDRCVNSLPEVTLRWDRTDYTAWYEVWRSPTGITTNKDGLLLSYPDPHFGEGLSLNRFSFNDPRNSVVVGQPPKEKEIYYYKVVAIGPGYPDGRTPSNWVGLRTRECFPPQVNLFLTGKGITLGQRDPPLTVKQNDPVSISWNTTDIPARLDACTASIPQQTGPIPSQALTDAWSNAKAETGNQDLPPINAIGNYNFTLTCQSALGIDITSNISLKVKETKPPWFKTTGGDVHTNEGIYISE